MHQVINIISYSQGGKRFFLVFLQIFCTFGKERWREGIKEKFGQRDKEADQD